MWIDTNEVSTFCKLCVFRLFSYFSESKRDNHNTRYFSYIFIPKLIFHIISLLILHKTVVNLSNNIRMRGKITSLSSFFHLLFVKRICISSGNLKKARFFPNCYLCRCYKRTNSRFTQWNWFWRGKFHSLLMKMRRISSQLKFHLI